VSAVLAAVTPAAAQPAPVADLDGTQLWIGPTGAARATAAGWESTWGGGVQVLRIREHPLVSRIIRNRRLTDGPRNGTCPSAFGA
jgi:hypothetical protein